MSLLHAPDIMFWHWHQRGIVLWELLLIWRFGVELKIHAFISQHADVTLFTECKCFHCERFLVRVVHVYGPNMAAVEL